MAPEQTCPQAPQLFGSLPSSTPHVALSQQVVPSTHGGQPWPPPDDPLLDPPDDPLLAPLEPPDDPLLEPLELPDDPLLAPLELPDDPLLAPLEPPDDPLLAPLEPPDDPLLAPLEPPDDPPLEPLEPLDPPDDPLLEPPEDPELLPDRASADASWSPRLAVDPPQPAATHHASALVTAPTQARRATSPAKPCVWFIVILRAAPRWYPMRESRQAPVSAPPSRPAADPGARQPGPRHAAAQSAGVPVYASGRGGDACGSR